ncbi:MAG TPA: hypothetical protein PKY12_11705, partial [Catalimonadaceae bacterium]|nr:hypothetical protein [Catalimonadaceae bacterium]
MTIRITLGWLFSLLFLATVSKAQLLQSFTFAGSQGTEITSPPNGQPTNGSLSHIKRGSGVTPNNAGGAFGATGFTTQANLDTADYFEFAVKANVGYQLRLDSIVVSERRSNTGIRKFVVRSSLDGFTENLSSFDLPDDNLFRNNQKTVFGSSFQQLSASTTASFRFFGYSAENETGSWRLDSIRVYGNISSVFTGPTISWNKTAESIPECLGQIQFQAVLSQAMNEDITFQVNASGNLSSNELSPVADFSQPITIPAGTTSISYSFSTQDDALEEQNENLILVLANPTGGVEIGQNGTFTLTVEDDDSPNQKYHFKQRRLTGSEGTSVQIPIRLHASSKVPPGGLIKLEVKGGSAVGTDFQSTQIGAIPLTTDSILQIQVQILQDGLAEPQGDSLILALRPSGSFGAEFLGIDTVFVLKMLDSQTEPLPPTRTIAQIRGNNINGGADSVGKKVRLYGTVYGLNQRLTSSGGGYQLYLRDATGGIGIFKTTPVSGITALNEGDSIKIMGTIEVFRGLSQI